MIFTGQIKFMYVQGLRPSALPFILLLVELKISYRNLEEQLGNKYENNNDNYREK